MLAISCRPLPGGLRVATPCRSALRQTSVIANSSLSLRPHVRTADKPCRCRKLTDSARRLAGWTVDVVGISLDSAEATKRYGEAQGLSFPLVTFPSRKLKQLYRARAVPQTLVLDEEGRVLYARTGLLEPTATLDSVYRALQWVRSSCWRFCGGGHSLLHFPPACATRSRSSSSQLKTSTARC